MNDHDRVVRAHEMVGLKDAALALVGVLDAAARSKQTYADTVAELLAAALRFRCERYLKARLRLIHLPFHKSLAAFAFSYQRSMDEGQIRELATLSLAQQAHDVILLGPPGVGELTSLSR